MNEHKKKETLKNIMSWIKCNKLKEANFHFVL